MKKEQILKMTKEEIEDYIWSEGENTDCYNCHYCYKCQNCYHCYNCEYCNNCDYCEYCNECGYCDHCYKCDNCDNCYACRNTKSLDYAILNIELTKEEYEKKMKELNANEN